jgi:hypothetical protein
MPYFTVLPVPASPQTKGFLPYSINACKILLETFGQKDKSKITMFAAETFGQNDQVQNHHVVCTSQILFLL